MTCIVGAVESGSVYIGADSMGSSGYCSQTIRQPKVFLLQDRFIVGYTTSFRMGQIIEHDFIAPKHPNGMSVETFMTSVFINDLRECLKNKGWAEKEKERESGGNFLVGYQGRLFEVQGDYSVLETTDGYNAVGSGYAYALGAMSCAVGGPRQRILTALIAAEKFTPSVSGPFTVLKLESIT